MGETGYDSEKKEAMDGREVNDDDGDAAEETGETSKKGIIDHDNDEKIATFRRKVHFFREKVQVDNEVKSCAHDLFS